MSEKTEKPTPQKLRDARKKGQVAKSTDVTSAVQLAVLLGYFNFEGPHLLEAFERLIDLSIRVTAQDLGPALMQLTDGFLELALRFVLGIAVMLIATTILSVVVQTGPLLAPEALKPSFDKVNPLGNLKQMFSMKSAFELLKSVLKVSLLALIFFYLIREHGPSIEFLPLCSVDCGLLVGTQLLNWLWMALAGFYVIFGIADYSFQRYNMNKQLMMSIEDIKQEYKNSEGNPEIKQHRKSTHREIQSGSLAANVKKSSVVVRNPTHVAVCLFYRAGETPLPRVLEIGLDARALHIVDLAERAGVPVVENVRVARALAKHTKVGSYIPAPLFEPVAQILRAVLALQYEGANDEDA
jgi:type III secretion protein U